MHRFPTPSEIMRANRPYLFSDSGNVERYRLSESELALHLESLTSRNQNKDFEVFCRRLSEREICPNLRPQTGPEGGGDGKVDTETFPVDELISDRWFVGDGRSGQERWGFAFSAKKTWAEKARADVRGMVSTDRGYNRVFVITSQPARQVDRLRIEDELGAETGVPVTILDREWIIDKVFAHGHKDIAYECLAAGTLEPEAPTLGPRDIARQRELDALEEKFLKMGSTIRDHVDAVSDALEAARLSRELERPFFETDGRYRRAERFARKYGAKAQLLRAIYEHAWTGVWWHDEFETIAERYDEVETLAFETKQAEYISKVCNLCQVLVTYVAKGFASSDEYKLEGRMRRLRDTLTVLSIDIDRPSNALFSEALLVLHRLNEGLLDQRVDDLDSAWDSLRTIIDRADRLGEFPAEFVDSVVSAISSFAPESTAFDRLVERLADFMGERNRQVTAGELYLTLGERKLDNDRPIDAIRWLGRAVVNLAKEECRWQQSGALYYLSIAYGNAGLRWAARATVLASIVQTLALSESEGKLHREIIPALRYLAHTSLRVGELVDALAAHHFRVSFKQIVATSEQQSQEWQEEDIEFDRFLSCLISIQPLEEIARLESVPDILGGLGLSMARAILLYRLGHLDKAVAEGSLARDIIEVAEMAAAEGMMAHLPTQLSLFDDRTPHVKTRILGVEIDLKSADATGSYTAVQTYAAAIEGLMATLLDGRAVPFRERLTITVSQSADSLEGTVTDTPDGSVLHLASPAGITFHSAASIPSLNRHLILASFHTLLGIAMVPDHEKTIQDLLVDESALDRALMFCHASLARSRVLGSVVGQLSDWSWLAGQNYPMIDPPAVAASSNIDVNAEEDEEGVQEEFRSHDELVVRTIINPKLWDAAGWSGIVYGTQGNDSEIDGEPPFFGLMFSNGEAGRAIFQDWIDRFGKVDVNDAIRVSLLRGIDRDNPFHYRGHVTQNIDPIEFAGNRKVVGASRTTTMEPENTSHLDLFHRYYEASGAFFLVPASFTSPGKPEFHLDLAIRKRSLVIRDAWEVGEHDPDGFAIRSDDNVFVPTEIVDPPINALLSLRRSSRPTRVSPKE